MGAAQCSRIDVIDPSGPFGGDPFTCGVLNEDSMQVCGAVTRVESLVPANVSIGGVCLDRELCQPDTDGVA
jgi:hypothetical protein